MEMFNPRYVPQKILLMIILRLFREQLSCSKVGFAVVLRQLPAKCI